MYNNAGQVLCTATRVDTFQLAAVCGKPPNTYHKCKNRVLSGGKRVIINISCHLFLGKVGGTLALFLHQLPNVTS